MDVVVEMLVDEPTPMETMPPPLSVGTNMELALISSDRARVIPSSTESAPLFGGGMDVPIVRTMANPNHSSPVEEVTESLKRKNSRLTQKLPIVPARMTSKKRRLVKESKLVLSLKGTTSSLLQKKSASDKVGKRKESSSRSR